MFSSFSSHLQAHHKLEPERSFPESSISLNPRSSPAVTKPLYTNSGGSVVGHAAISSPTAAHPCTVQGGELTTPHDEHLQVRVLPDEQV